MTVTAGTRLGVYEVTTLIGTGGMGELYRARDTELHRDVYVRAFPGPGSQWQYRAPVALYPRWRHDGKELYYMAPDARLMAVSIVAGKELLQPGSPTPLFQARNSLAADPVRGTMSRTLADS